MHDEILEMLETWDEQEWDEGLGHVLFKALREWGADVDGALDRFLDDDALYAKCVLRFSQDDVFLRFEKSLEDGNFHKAFEAIHSMKGTCAILNLYPLGKPVKEVTEFLRVQQLPPRELMDEYHQLLSDYRSLVEKQVEIRLEQRKLEQ